MKPKLKSSDIILLIAAIYLLFSIPWGNTTSFHHLMLFLYLLCIMLRLSNIRKQGMKKNRTDKKQDHTSDE